MVKKILAGLAILILAFVAFAATRPADFVITRKATIAAPPAVIFTQVNDFKLWKAWSPWEGLDAKMTTTYEGPAAGPGAIYTWKGNDQVGEGRMTIVESKPNDFVSIKLEFLKPFEATNSTTLSFVGSEQGTEVTWKLEGKNNFMSKAAGVFMNMDEMIGKDFSKGLAQLKAVSEAEAKKAPAPEAAAAPPAADPAAPPVATP